MTKTEAKTARGEAISRGHRNRNLNGRLTIPADVRELLAPGPFRRHYRVSLAARRIGLPPRGPWTPEETQLIAEMLNSDQINTSYQADGRRGGSTYYASCLHGF